MFCVEHDGGAHFGQIRLQVVPAVADSDPGQPQASATSSPNKTHAPPSSWACRTGPGLPRMHHAQVPMMLKYTVGWAFAFAVEAQLAELKRDRPELCDGGFDADGSQHQGGAADCFRLDLAAAASLTALSGLVLLVAKPLAYNIECGGHTGRNSRPAPHMARLFSGQRRLRFARC